MNKNDFFPILTAEPLQQKDDVADFYLFNSSTKKGFAVKGLAGILCRRFDGTTKLGDLVAALEKDYQLEKNQFSKEIESFMNSLEENGLVELRPTKKE